MTTAPPANNKTGADSANLETGPDSAQKCGTLGPSAEEVSHHPQYLIFRALGIESVGPHSMLSYDMHDQFVRRRGGSRFAMSQHARINRDRRYTFEEYRVCP